MSIGVLISHLTEVATIDLDFCISCFLYCCFLRGEMFYFLILVLFLVKCQTDLALKIKKAEASQGIKLKWGEIYQVT